MEEEEEEGEEIVSDDVPDVLAAGGYLDDHQFLLPMVLVEELLEIIDREFREADQERRGIKCFIFIPGLEEGEERPGPLRRKLTAECPIITGREGLVSVGTPMGTPEFEREHCFIIKVIKGSRSGSVQGSERGSVQWWVELKALSGAPQEAWLILARSVNSKADHLMRRCEPQVVYEPLKEADKLTEALLRILEVDR